jgi:8-oxo-dGTP diphosphatase
MSIDPKTPPQAQPLEAWPRPSVTVDVVVLTVLEEALHVALYQRQIEPEQGSWALPGGFLNLDESLEQAAARVLRNKVGPTRVFLEQLYTFGDVLRDPRGRVLTVAYFALVDAERLLSERLETATLAKLDIPWSGETGGPVTALDPATGHALPLFLDHADILGLAVKRLRGKLDYSPVGFQLLPAEFTLRELQLVHEVVRAEPLNKDSFRRKMLASGLLEATGNHERDVPYRPAELYRFARRSAL